MQRPAFRMQRPAFVPHSLRGALNIDEALALTNSGATYSLIHDALGSTLAITDSLGYRLVEYNYEPFGKSASTDAGFPNPFQYTGRENDGTGLYFYRSRYYHPQLYRYVSEDFWGLAGWETNAYAYVGNNPATFVDPLGWWKTRWHEQVTREKMRQLGGFSDNDVEAAVKANREMDTRDPLSWINPWDPNHYMPGSNTARADWIIQDKFREAVERNRAGDRPGAMRSLGEALHTLQDASAHAEADPPGTMWRHIVGLLPFIPHPDNPADNPAGWERARRDTECLLRDFKGGARGSKCR